MIFNTALGINIIYQDYGNFPYSCVKLPEDLPTFSDWQLQIQGSCQEEGGWTETEDVGTGEMRKIYGL